jgi:uncharacterized NAD-dependent epimerase/dehydratase family protein
MKEKAIVITAGLLHTSSAKTAHGLIRDSEKFEIVGIVDPVSAGKDAGEVLDGKKRNIPIFADIETAILHTQPAFCIVGVATAGGIFPESMLADIKKAIQHKISIVNGLHDYLSDNPEIAALAQQNGVELIDIRRPKKRRDLHFWTGEIFNVKAPIIAVLGMDCAMGKRTTTRLIMQACQQHGINAQMIYTGQTGWLQGGKYGFIFDSTLNDFVSGELENAIVSCYKDTQAEVILLEGQAALRNPSGPCGSEMLISGNAKYVILLYAPKREFYDDEPHLGKIPTVESEIELIRNFGSEVIALSLNTTDCTLQEATDYQKLYQQKLGIPVLLPLEEGVGGILPVIEQLSGKKTV